MSGGYFITVGLRAMTEQTGSLKLMFSTRARRISPSVITPRSF